MQGIFGVNNEKHFAVIVDFQCFSFTFGDNSDLFLHRYVVVTDEGDVIECRLLSCDELISTYTLE